jgi:hypothetical protein
MRDVVVRWRRSTVALAVVLACACALAVPAVRAPVLRMAGRALVANDPIEPVDVIVVGSEADGAGVLEAADLQHSGIATRVAVFSDPPDADVDREFIRRGVPYEDAAERSIRQLRSLGVESVERIPRSDAVADANRVLAAWCSQSEVRSVILVISSHHSRRLRRELHRAMPGHRTKVTIRSARYSDFDPDRWWWTRSGIRTEVVEFQRLLLDLARHPFS